MSVGTRCTLRCYHWEPPEPVEGDFLRTDAGSCYRIERIRESDYDHIAYVLTVMRLGKDAVQFGEEGVSRWVWAKRGSPAPARSGPSAPPADPRPIR